MNEALLQLWDSQKLNNPTTSLSGFLKGIVDAAAILRPTQVCCWCVLVVMLTLCLLSYFC